jgi:hypothetical protein
MNVYKKLQEARIQLQNTKLNKSGKNKFAGFSYFELSDFIPQVTEIFNKVGLCGVVSFTSDTAYLTVHETESDGFVTFTSPLVMAENAKGQAIQSLGATHTYFRRYLWLLALELTEHDSIDSLPQEDKPKPIAVEVKPVVKPQEPEQNLDVLADVLIQFGDTCESLKELSSFWKQNQAGIDHMKVGNPELFKKVQSAFAQYKSKFKE